MNKNLSKDEEDRIRRAIEAIEEEEILGSTDDMVEAGLVKSLSRLEGNTTGTSFLSTELDGKRQEILIEAVPGLRQMAALADSNTTAGSRLQAFLDAARARNVEKVFPVLREKFPQAYFGGLVALSKMIRWETAEEMLSGGSMTPDEIIEKLEQRVGPEGRKLFEQFLRKVNKLQAEQYLEAQARTVENRGGDRGR